MEEYDVVIVGAGPGGATAAAYLGRAGNKTLLLDKAKFPRDKICGDAQGGKGLTIMYDLGVRPEVDKLNHAKIYGVLFSAPNGKTVDIPFKVAYEKGMHGYVSRRMDFDNIMFNAAKATDNVTVMEEFSATELVKDGEKVIGVKGMDRNKVVHEFRAKVVIGADGSNSMVAKGVGVWEIDKRHQATALRAYYKGVKGMTDRIELHFVDEVIPGYFWIFPIEGDSANVGLGMLTDDMEKKKVKLTELLDKIVKENPMFKERFASAELVGPIRGWTLPLATKKRKMYGDGWMLIGDAASMIDPFSGEGVGNAMIGGKIAAQIASQAIKTGDVSASVLKKYQDMIWEILDEEVRTSYRMQRMGAHKWLLNLIVNRTTKSKGFQDILAGSLGNTDSMKNLMSPLGILKALIFG